MLTAHLSLRSAGWKALGSNQAAEFHYQNADFTQFICACITCKKQPEGPRNLRSPFKGQKKKWVNETGWGPWGQSALFNLTVSPGYRNHLLHASLKQSFIKFYLSNLSTLDNKSSDSLNFVFFFLKENKSGCFHWKKRDTISEECFILSGRWANCDRSPFCINSCRVGLYRSTRSLSFAL